MNGKRWLAALTALTFLPSAASATIETPIGDQVAAQADLDGAPAEAAAPEWVGLDATQGYAGPDGRMGIQDQVTEVGRQAAAFHDNMLLPIITAICIFVLILLIWAMVRYRRSANPEPSRTTHNTAIEVIWTVVPVLILLVLAVPSIGLIKKQYDAPPADLTVKVIGNQWYWEYEYPDMGISIVSNMLLEEDDPDREEGSRFRTDADGPALLAVDERLVIPAGKNVKFLMTANDVIHSFAVPAFWMKLDTVPGRINETWVNVETPGLYFGQCSELCGARHAYMPIAVEVLPEDQFNAWVAAKGGTLPGEGEETAAEDEESAADALEAGDEAAAEEAEAAAANTNA
ncbi:cytochrome c oxidase subunit II [Sphingomicrobium aestuariivivum]|uniref:cytochrome c oxidase subunit II n=1 Tax=Sphingomicrobium aestuariivivum TaxID=1582356 RepID=UPI001FD71FB1|nr:cytochrome c oxidase subunit II [Sphingomicrobium aestuariivivum]MCJ8191343.1 cytochrome c oxidase subunit II [Sphingomicrobium aestuariivivum]